MNKTTPIIKQVKIKLDEIKNESKKNHFKQSWRNNFLNTATRNYRDAMIHFQSAVSAFRDGVRDDFVRQARIGEFLFSF